MKLSTTKLIGLLAILVAIYFGVEYFGGKTKSKSLKTELVQIDTASVTKLQIISPTNSATVTKIGGEWQVTLDGGKTVPADKNTVMQSLSALNGIKPARMATRKREKWSEYQVDSAGTQVTVFAEGDKVSDIILGKLGVTGQRAYHTFVRLTEDDEVYVADNFMSFSVPSETAAYRLKNLVSINKDSLSSVQFTYLADTSFRLEKVGSNWLANGNEVDSVKTAKFIRGLSNITSRKFANEFDQLGEPIYKAEYGLNNGSSVIVDGYLYEGGLVFNSSDNTTSYFADSTLLNKVFTGYSALQK